MPSKKGVKKAAKPLKTVEQLIQFVAHVETRPYREQFAWHQQRDLFIIRLIMGSALRVSDVALLLTDDLNNTRLGDSFEVIEKKTGKTKRVYMTDTLHNDWHNYREAADKYGARIKKYAITSHCTTYRTDRPVNPQSISQNLKKLGIECGMPVSVTAHTLRKTAARLRYDQGVSIEVISKYLNHANIATTMIYLGLDAEDVKKAATMEFY